MEVQQVDGQQLGDLQLPDEKMVCTLSENFGHN
jgi:hypothetical protein